MRRVLLQVPLEYEILSWRDVRPNETYMEFHDVGYAQRFLTGFADDCRNEEAFRCCLLETTCFAGSCRCHNHACRLLLAHALVLGHIKIVSKPVRPPDWVGQSPKPFEPDEPDELPLTPSEPVEPLKWVEFVVLNEDTGEPCDDAFLIVTLPTRNAVRYEANPSGVIRIEDIATGSTCDVNRLAAPEILEVISIS